MAVSKRTRYEVLKRDNHTCRYCGRAAPDVKLTIDHVTPTTLGGTDNPGNLVTACIDCNAGKSSTAPGTPLVEDVTQDAVRWAAAMKLAAENRRARQAPMNAYGQQFLDEWNEYVHGAYSDPVLPNGWEDSVEHFYKAGLPIDELLRAISISMSRGRVDRWEKFRYMCGIAWSVLTEIQEEAAKIARDGDK